MPLFRQMAPAQQHSRTSMAAADSLDENALNRLQRQVLAVIAAASAGLTDEEIQLHTGMNPARSGPGGSSWSDVGLSRRQGPGRRAAGGMLWFGGLCSAFV
jgi:hypothetical protein